MSNAASPQKLAENEAVFRESNERVHKTLKNLQAKAKEEDHTNRILKENSSLHFFCECSDENCRERIVMKQNTYEKLHKDRDQFIIIPGHQVVSIEKTVIKKPKYAVVKKLIPVPQKAKSLNKTDIDNS
ncbi:MAG: hypothetical protein V4702_01570 [Patescibacteria group bacterium]